MPNSSQITRWVLDYKAAGVDALKTKKKGRKRKMDKEKVEKRNSIVEIIHDFLEKTNNKGVMKIFSN